MTIINQEVLKLNVVLLGAGLLAEPEEQFCFATRVATDLGSEVLVSAPNMPVPPAFGIEVDEAATLLTLLKDRIALHSFAARAIIEQDYPVGDDLERLAGVVGYAIECTNPDRVGLTAFGVNLQMSFASDSGLYGQRYIAERLYGGRTLSDETWTLFGGTGRVFYDSGDGAIWNFNLEPRGNDPTNQRVYLGVNMHMSEPPDLGGNVILTNLREVWKQTQFFAVRLDEAN